MTKNHIKTVEQEEHAECIIAVKVISMIKQRKIS